MIILDTNVVSELVRPVPEPAVVAWVDAQPASDVFVTAVTAAEMVYGVARLPPGRRRTHLAEKVELMVKVRLARRVRAFDVVAAGHYGAIVARREASGRPISMADAQIAAICRSDGAVLATRNVADFADVGIEIVNPWTTPT